jgi:hypothetical protein
MHLFTSAEADPDEGVFVFICFGFLLFNRKAEKQHQSGDNINAILKQVLQ